MRHAARIRDFIDCRRGNIAIETAFILPILILILVGVVEVTSIYDARQRSTAAANSLGDIVSQQDAVTGVSVATFLTATQALLRGDGSVPSARVSSVAVTAEGNASQVQWSFASNMDAYAKGERLNLDGLDDIACPSGSVIIAEVILAYQGSIRIILADSPVLIERRAIFCPRAATSPGIPDET